MCAKVIYIGLTYTHIMCRKQKKKTKMQSCKWILSENWKCKRMFSLICYFTKF